MSPGSNRTNAGWWTDRASHLCLLWIVLVLCAVAALPTERAMAVDVTESTYGAWTLRCEQPTNAEQSNCIMLQNLVLQAGGHTVLQLSIGIPPNDGVPTVLISLPLGISLPPGISIRIDSGDARNFPVERCEPDGCRAGIKVRKQTVQQLRQGEILEITFFDNQRQPISMPLSLDGFGNAFDVLVASTSATGE